jgi:hypothetical protein
MKSRSMRKKTPIIITIIGKIIGKIMEILL